MAFVDLTEIATQIIEAAGALGSIYVSFKLLAIARNYYTLYKDQREYYYNTFQYGVEAPLAALVLAEPVYVLDYSAQAQTIYNVSTGPFGGQSGDIGGWWDRHAAMYHSVRDPAITELAADKARLQSDWANYLFRFEEHNVDTHNDIRWNKRLAIHNIGLKQGAYISSALATSFSAYEAALEGTADALSAMGNGAAQYAGYRRGMADTNADFLQYGYKQHKNVPHDNVQDIYNRTDINRPGQHTVYSDMRTTA